MKILNGTKLANKIILQLKKKVATMKRKPVLAMVLVGDDPASAIYVRRKGVLPSLFPGAWQSRGGYGS